VANFKISNSEKTLLSKCENYSSKNASRELSGAAGRNRRGLGRTQCAYHFLARRMRKIGALKVSRSSCCSFFGGGFKVRCAKDYIIA
jgi:hypothetical protein